MGERMLSEGAGGRAADAAPSGAVFMVVSGEQLEAAKAVARHLPFASSALNPYTDLTVPLADVNAVERPVGFVTPRAIAAARRAVRRALALAGGRRAVLVAGQDEGTVERAAIATARAVGARLVMMPDGIPTNVKALPPLRRRPAWLVKNLIDRALVASRVLVGRRSDLFSSNPDLVLSWGRGWDARYGGPRRTRSSPTSARPGRTALPRSRLRRGSATSSCAASPCSCRSTTTSPPRRTSRARYRWLSELDQARDPRVRVRLHPEEHPRRDTVSPPRCARSRPSRRARCSRTSAGLTSSSPASRRSSWKPSPPAASPMTAGGMLVWGRTAGNAFLEDPRVPCLDFRRSRGVEELVAARGRMPPPPSSSARTTWPTSAVRTAQRGGHRVPRARLVAGSDAPPIAGLHGREPTCFAAERSALSPRSPRRRRRRPRSR